jgi:hypothetical protein
MWHSTAFDLEHVQVFLASLPADDERARRLQTLAEARDALDAARERDGALITETAANTDALLTATGKERERLLTERARHTAERDALPQIIEILTRRWAEALVAACQSCHRQAVVVHDEADAVIRQHAFERTKIVNALTRLESSTMYPDDVAAKRSELQQLDRRLQPHRDRREQARQVVASIDGTLHALLGEGSHATHVHPDTIERFVKRATRRAA